MKILVDNLGEILKNSRLEKNMYLKDVSLATGVSSGYISRIENGSSMPSLEVLIKLCNIYSLDINNYVNEANTISTEDFSIENILMNNRLFYKDKELSIKDRLNILRFTDFILSSDDENVKDIYMSILENFNKLKIKLEVKEDE